MADTSKPSAWAKLEELLAQEVSGLSPTAAAERGKALDDLLQNSVPLGAKLSREQVLEFLDLARRVEARQAELAQPQEEHEQSVQQFPEESVGSTTTHCVAAAETPQSTSTEFKASSVPDVEVHVDLFGEGRYPKAVNVGTCTQTSTTGSAGRRVPNLILRKFSAKGPNELPFADGVADLITAENGPIHYGGLTDEIARVIRPGGTIILYGPSDFEYAHEAVATKVKGKWEKKIPVEDVLESTIAVPE